MKLNLYLVITFVSVVASVSGRIEQFYGDASLQSFVKDFCAKSTPFASLILVDSLQVEQNSNISMLHTRANSHFKQTLNLNEYMQKIDCDFEHLENVTIRGLRQAITENGRLQFRTLQLIFNFGMHSMNSVKFYSILNALSDLYMEYVKCLPFVVLFDESPSNLHQWTSVIFGYFHRHFRSTLVSVRSGKVLHIRPIVDGCYLYPDLFEPQNAHDFHRLKVDYLKCNLHERILNVSVNNDFPFCSIRTDRMGRIRPQYSVELQLLALLQDRLNFTSNLIDAKNGWGIKVNSSWTGVIGQVYNGTTQIGMCEMARTNERLQVLDFSEHIFVDQVVALSQSPKLHKTDLVFNNKIHYSVWLCVLASFFLVANAAHFMTKLTEEAHLKQLQHRMIAYGTIIVKLYAIYMKESIDSIIKEQLSPMRIIYGCWMLSGIIFSTILSSIFYSTLAYPEYEPAMDSLLDLHRAALHDTHSLITKSETNLYSALINAQPHDGLFYEIGQHMRRQGHPMIESQDQVIGTVERDSRNVVLAMKINARANRFVRARMQLHISEASLGSVCLAWALGKRSPLIAPFNLVINRFQEMGLFEKYLTNTIRNQSAHTSSPTKRYMHLTSGANPTTGRRARTFKVVRLDDMSSLFMFWTFGMSLAVALFGLELFFDYFFADYIHSLIWMDHDHRLFYFDEQHHLHMNLHLDLHMPHLSDFHFHHEHEHAHNNEQEDKVKKEEEFQERKAPSPEVECPGYVWDKVSLHSI